MSDQMEFIDGLFAKAPHPNAPDFVKAKISIKREELINWLNNRSDEWVNIDVKEGRTGKWYASVDNWKPDPAMAGNSKPFESTGNSPEFISNTSEQEFDDDIPF
mgnify:FL=1